MHLNLPPTLILISCSHTSYSPSVMSHISAILGDAQVLFFLCLCSRSVVYSISLAISLLGLIRYSISLSLSLTLFLSLFLSLSVSLSLYFSLYLCPCADFSIFDLAWQDLRRQMGACSCSRQRRSSLLWTTCAIFRAWQGPSPSVAVQIVSVS